MLNYQRSVTALVLTPMTACYIIGVRTIYIKTIVLAYDVHVACSLVSVSSVSDIIL